METSLLASLAAISLTAGAVLHSYACMCRKLPPLRKGRYPQSRVLQLLLELAWILLAGFAFLCAWLLQGYYLGLSAVLYFIVLPILIQPAMAKQFGFYNLREYVEAVDAWAEAAENEEKHRIKDKEQHETD